MQQQTILGHECSKYLFASEMEQLWNIALKKAPDQVYNKMPHYWQDYVLAITVQEMKDVSRADILSSEFEDKVIIQEE